jgi:hypothetical protein
MNTYNPEVTTHKQQALIYCSHPNSHMKYPLQETPDPSPSTNRKIENPTIDTDNPTT